MRIGTLVRKLVVNTGLAAASFLIAILLLEIGARVFSPDSAPATVSLASFYRYDELLGWAQVPDQRGRLRARDFNVSVVTDSSGLRDNETTVERAAGRHRMLVLGDSYGWGWGVERSDRFSEILETRLSGWEVINASVPGYSTDQQLLYLQQLGLRYEPDVVLLLFYGNDHRGNLSDTQYGYNKPFFTLENESLVAHNIPVPPDSMLQRAGRYIYAQTFVIGRLADFAATAGRSGYRSLARAAAGGFGGSTGEAPGGPPGAEYAAVGAGRRRARWRFRGRSPRLRAGYRAARREPDHQGSDPPNERAGAESRRRSSRRQRAAPIPVGATTPSQRQVPPVSRLRGDCQRSPGRALRGGDGADDLRARPTLESAGA